MVIFPFYYDMKGFFLFHGAAAYILSIVKSRGDILE